jgi:DNA-binding transcriptional regulator YiaG
MFILNQRMGKRVPQKAKREFMDALKSWRARNGLSQSEAAERLGVPLKTLQNWEIARTKPQGFAEAALLKIIAK